MSCRIYSKEFLVHCCTRESVCDAETIKAVGLLRPFVCVDILVYALKLERRKLGNLTFSITG